MPWGRTLVHDVLPGISGPVLVDYGLRVVWSVGIVATLGVLGVGIQPPAADWGLMINDNRIGMAAQPLSVLVPLALIAAFAIGVNLVTDGLARRIARVRDDA
jgi:peptide/nickel transport system permease protein